MRERKRKMKITVEKEKNRTLFSYLKEGDVFIIPHKENPDVFIKISKIHQLSGFLIESLLEGIAKADELEDCEANAYSFKSNQFVWFDPTDDIIKVEAEVIVHN